LEDRTLLTSYTAATVSDLIADINAANQGGGANTITLAASTTFTLKRVDNTTDGATGLPVIAAGDQLTLLGNGDTVQRGASGAPAFRLFDVASGASLTLENLTLQNGLAFGSGTAARGGALYNQGSLLLSGVTVQDNIAHGADGVNGTNSYPYAGTPGQSAWGGGIYSGGSLTLENGSQLLSNQVLGGNGGNPYKSRGPGGDGGDGLGGGLFVSAGTVNLTNTTVSSNQAHGGVAGAAGTGITFGGTSAGGGIYFSSGTFIQSFLLKANVCP
jgi:hypothetical protein